MPLGLALVACSLEPPDLFGPGVTAPTGGGGSGAATTTGDGGAGGLPTSCAELPAGSASGPHALDLDGAGAAPSLEVYCNTVDEGGGWALVLSSVGDPSGATTAFWNIPYAQRLADKGAPDPEQLAYFGSLYPFAKEIKDEIVDTTGKRAVAVIASVGGIDPATMKLVSPTLVSGDASVFGNHVASGWSSADHDGDPEVGNCAQQWAGVTQHYGSCWVYNLGATTKGSIDDAGWGPHATQPVLTALGLASDSGPNPERVARISRWARW